MLKKRVKKPSRMFPVKILLSLRAECTYRDSNC